MRDGQQQLPTQLRRIGTNIYPRDLDTHLLSEASLGEAVGLVVELEFGFEGLDLMLGKSGLRLCHILMVEHQGWMVLLGEERVSVRSYKVLMRSAGMPYWLSRVHVRLNPLRVLHLHLHIWRKLLLLGVEAVLFLLLSSVFSLFLYLSVYKRQGVVVVESLAVK